VSPIIEPHGRRADSWWGAGVPVTEVTLSAFTYIGITFTTDVPGRLFGARLFEVTETSPHWCLLWQTNDTGNVLAAKTFRLDVAPVSDWRQTWFRPVVRIVNGMTYRLCVLSSQRYKRTTNALTSPVTHNHIQFLKGWQTTSLVPPQATITENSNANGVDVLFQPD